MAPTPSRLSSMAHRLPLLQNLAYRRHLGTHQPGYPRTSAGSLEKELAAQCGHCGLPVGKDYRRVGGEDRGYDDGAKKVKGRKRHLLVDTEGFVLKAKVHSAKVMDWDGIKTLLQRADMQFPRLKHLWVDAGYRGEDRGKDWVEKKLGWSVDLVERPRKPAPKEVLMAWAEQWLHEGVVVDWEKLLPPKGFVVLPRRWVVERSFAWISHNRRMSKDYERLCASGEALVYAAMSRLMVRRLARA